MTNIPLWLNLTILFFPLLLSTTIGLWINILLRKINRQEGGKAWTIKKNFIMACVISSPLAALTQILLQGQIESYIYIENPMSMIIFDAVMSPFLVLMLNNILLWYFNKKGWDNAYRFVRVKHAEPPEYYADDVSDFTIKNYTSTNLNGNDKSAE